MDISDGAAGADLEDDDHSGSVRTVLVAAKVLETIAKFQEPVRLTELARALKMTLPRVSRHLATLRSLGYIEKTDLDETYRLGTKLFILGQIALEHNSLQSIATTHLTKLRDSTKRTVMLSARQGSSLTVLTCLAGKVMPTIVVRPGTILEYPSSPSARILRAIEDGIASFETPHADAHPILRDFYDFEADARSSGIGSVAAPLFDHENQIVGVIAVVMPSNAFAPAPEAALVRDVKTCAARISSEMGSSAWDQRLQELHLTEPG